MEPDSLDEVSSPIRTRYMNLHIYSGEVAFVDYAELDTKTGRPRARVVVFNLVRGRDGTCRRIENKIFCYGELAKQASERLVAGMRVVFVSEVEQIMGDGGRHTMIFGRMFGVMPSVQRSGRAALEALHLELAAAICDAQEE